MALLWVFVISYLGYPQNDSLYLHFQQRFPKSAGIWLCGCLLKDLWGLPDAFRREPRAFSRSFNSPYNMTQLACAYHLSLFFRDPGIQLSLPEPGHSLNPVTFTPPCICSCSSLFSVVFLNFECHSLFLSLLPPIKWWKIPLGGSIPRSKHNAWDKWNVYLISSFVPCNFLVSPPQQSRPPLVESPQKERGKPVDSQCPYPPLCPTLLGI